MPYDRTCEKWVAILQPPTAPCRTEEAGGVHLQVVAFKANASPGLKVAKNIVGIDEVIQNGSGKTSLVHRLAKEFSSSGLFHLACEHPQPFRGVHCLTCHISKIGGWNPAYHLLGAIGTQ